jgi:hypothetical protein
LFEAGALGMADRGRVVTFLLGLSLGELQPPLGLFQGTVASSRDDVFKMVVSMNKRVLEPLGDRLLEKSFDANWPSLETRLKGINTEEAEREERSSDPTPLLAEILNVVRRIERDTPRWRPGGLGTPINWDGEGNLGL